MALRFTPNPSAYPGPQLVVSGDRAASLNFWSNPQTWPLDPRGYVFLARAVATIGHAMFGEEWTGKEPGTEAIRPLPALERSSTADRLQAHVALSRRDPKYVRWRAAEAQGQSTTTSKVVHSPSSKAPTTVSSHYSAYGWTSEWWSAARTAIQGEQEAQRSILERLAHVQREIVIRCESEELKSAIRPRVGGEMNPIPRNWWNTENWAYRFALCQLDPTDPFGSDVSGERHYWVFVTEESLKQFVAKQRHGTKAEDYDAFHLSPYLKMMLAANKRLAISPDNQPKKEVVLAELRACWKGPVELSDRLLHAAATMLREPESQLGKASKRR
jgi:hypothetical protein